MSREQHRLAAIASADVAGYSRLMGRDESQVGPELEVRYVLEFAGFAGCGGGI